MKNNIIVFSISAILALVIGFLMNTFVKIGIPASIGIGLIVFLLPLIWGKPEFGLALVAFFLPFERIPTLDIGGMTLKINHVLIIVVFIVLLVKRLAEGNLVIPKDPIRFLISLFIASLMFSLPQAINLTRSLQILLFMLLMLIVYLAVTFIVDSKKTLIYVLYGLILGAAFQGALGLFQFAGDAIGVPTTVTLLKEGYDKSTFGFARVQGTAIEPLYFADYILIPFFVSIVLLLRGQADKLFNKFWFYVLAGVLLLDFILAISRGAYIALAVAFLVLIITQAKLIFRAKTILTATMILLLILTGSYLALVKSEPRAIDEFVGHLMVNDATTGESVVSRISATELAYQMYQDHPYFGVGLGNYGPIVQKNPAVTPDSGWFIVNNEYIELLAENGAVGLAMFLLVIFFVFVRALSAIRRNKDEFLKSVLIGLSLALIGIIIQYATFSTLYIFHIWFLIGLISALTYLTSRPAGSDELIND